MVRVQRPKTRLGAPFCVIQMTWRPFVGRARMIRAMELLSGQDVPVIEVAYSVGFESVSAFSTAFRRFVGETPSRYRRRFVPSTTLNE